MFCKLCDSISSKALIIKQTFYAKQLRNELIFIGSNNVRIFQMALSTIINPSNIINGYEISHEIY